MIHTALIIQARTKSTRLPNKILMPFFEDYGCLEILINRLKEHVRLPIIIATSTNASDDIIEQLAFKLEVECYRGDEKNVLNRFIECAKKFDVSNIVRICSDNPFLDMDDLTELIDFDMHGFDYVSFRIQDVPSIKTHYGLWAEKVTIDTLINVSKYTKDELYLEHVTNYIYSNPELFICYLINRTGVTPDYPVRLTLDTQEDLDLLSEIYAILINSESIVTRENIFKIISENEFYQKSMDLQINKNSK